MTARLCVASYGEDVSWVADTGMEACIYDATGKRDGLIPVPNEAREASQYLRHIVEHYGRFRDYELFLQGNPFDHNPRILHWLEIRVWEGKTFQALGRTIIPFTPRSSIPHSKRIIPFANSIGVRKVSEFKSWTVGAMFAVSRERLMFHPLEWWETLLEKTVNERTWSPWVMEQLWTTILSPPLTKCM